MSYQAKYEVPTLKIDGILFGADSGREMSLTAKLYRRGVYNLLEFLRHNGFTPEVVDLDEDQIKTESTVEAMEQIFNLDDCWIQFRSKETKERGSLWIILGNEPNEIVSDWRYKPNGRFNALVEEFADNIERYL